MTKTTLTAPENVLTILKAASVDAGGITLNGQLDRKDYEAVNKFLTVAGAKWNRSKGRHLFTTPQAFEKIKALLETGNVRDEKKHFQAFYTPSDVADEMVMETAINDQMGVCDPSAGRGRLLMAAVKFAHNIRMTAFEIDESQTDLAHIAHRTHYGDFLKVSPSDWNPFDRILMNPPYAAIKGIGPQDIAHTLHAVKFLKPGGVLVGLCAGGPKQEEALRGLCNSWRRMPKGTFKESGTDIETVMFRMVKL